MVSEAISYIENINGSELLLEAAHYHTVLIAQICNFRRVNFMYFRILIFNHYNECDAMLRLAF